MKYCKYCGEQLENGDLFCPGCGRKTEESGGKFNAGGFFKTLILVILPVISAVMLFLGWISFSGNQAGNLSAIISSCAGYTDNRVVQALGDGSLSPMELPKMADSVREIAKFLAVTNDTESLALIENVFRVLGMAAILALAFAVIAIVFRSVKPLKVAKNVDFALFFLQLLLLISFVFISVKINSYIEANAAGISMLGGLDTIRMKVTPWGIIACICAVPSCLIDLIRFPGEEKKRGKPVVTVLTAIGSIVLAMAILAATAVIFRTRTSAQTASGSNQASVTEQTTFANSGQIQENTSGVTQETAPAVTQETTSAATQETTTQAATRETASVSDQGTATSGGEQVASAIRKHLPITTFAAPSSGSRYVYAYTDSTLSGVDTGSLIDCEEDEIVIVDISTDGKAVQVKYPLDNGGYKTRWFDVKDIFGTAAGNVQTYIAAKDAKSYNISSSGSLNEQGYIGVGEEGTVIGTRTIGGKEYEATIYPIEPHTVNEVNNVSYRIAWILKDSYK